MLSRNYLTTILQDGEKIIHHFHVADIFRKILFISNIIFGILFLLPLLLIFIFAPTDEFGARVLVIIILPLIISPFLYVYLVTIFTEYLITDKRIMVKTGIFSRNVKEMNLNSVETVTVKEGIIDRIIKTGTIRVTGRGNEEICLKGIDEPAIVRQKVETNL